MTLKKTGKPLVTIATLLSLLLGASLMLLATSCKHEQSWAEILNLPKPADPSSPSRIAFKVGKSKYSGSIFSMRSDGTGLAWLGGDDRDNCYAPCWSPDRKKIAYVSTNVVNVGESDGEGLPEDSEPQIWVMNPDGSGKRFLTSLLPASLEDKLFSGLDSKLEGLCWSEESDLVIYFEIGRDVSDDQSYTLCSVGLDGRKSTYGPVKPPGDGVPYAPKVSPNGKDIFYLSLVVGGADKSKWSSTVYLTSLNRSALLPQSGRQANQSFYWRQWVQISSRKIRVVSTKKSCPITQGCGD
jgi:hypothetical protein